MTNDLYGFKDGDLEHARMAVEQALDVRMVPHESLYLGDYYRLGSSGQENMVLRRNVDPLDGEPAEQAFANMPLLLYVTDTDRPEELQQILTSKIPGLTLLRRRAA